MTRTDMTLLLALNTGDHDPEFADIGDVGGRLVVDLGQTRDAMFCLSHEQETQLLGLLLFRADARKT